MHELAETNFSTTDSLLSTLLVIVYSVQIAVNDFEATLEIFSRFSRHVCPVSEKIFFFSVNYGPIRKSILVKLYE